MKPTPEHERVMASLEATKAVLAKSRAELDLALAESGRLKRQVAKLNRCPHGITSKQRCSICSRSDVALE